MRDRIRRRVQPLSRRVVSAAVVAFAAAGCEAGPGADTIVERDSAGIVIVENRRVESPAVALWVSDAPLLRLGAVSAEDPALEFSRIRGATRLSDGRIVVLEYQGAEIRWFDANGRHLATRGGIGGAPFEFNAAGQLIRLPGDTVIVVDRPYNHLVVFGPDTEFVRREEQDRQHLLALVGRTVECPMETLADRSILLCVPEAGQPEIGPSPGPGHLRRIARFVRVPWTLDAVDTLGLYGGLEQWGLEHDGRVSYFIHPFHSRTALATGGSPPRVAIAINPVYSIEVWTADGRLDHIVRLAGGRRAPTDEERASVPDRLFGTSSNEALSNRALAEIEEPDSLPAILALAISARHELWALGQALPDGSDVNAWTVFDEAGRNMGAAMLPPRFQPLEIGDDYVLGVRYDENMVSFVELYSLDRGTS